MLQCTIFVHISNAHSFHAALYSYYTFSTLHFSCVPLFLSHFFSCRAFFMLYFFHDSLSYISLFYATLFPFAIISNSSFFRLHFFHAARCSCFTFQRHQEIKFCLEYIRSMIETLSEI